MKRALLLLTLALAGCTPDQSSAPAQRSSAQRDAESYAIASCLTLQNEPYLKDQGDAWASVVIERSAGEVETFGELAAIVKREVSKGTMAVVRSEMAQGKDKELPLLFCGEIVDAPDVRRAINQAVSSMASAYAATRSK